MNLKSPNVKQGFDFTKNELHVKSVALFGVIKSKVYHLTWVKMQLKFK